MGVADKGAARNAVKSPSESARRADGTAGDAENPAAASEISLQGEKVRLRSLEAGDVEFLYTWENDPRVWRYGDCGFSPDADTAPDGIRFSRETLLRFIELQRQGIHLTGQLRLIISRLQPARVPGDTPARRSPDPARESLPLSCQTPPSPQHVSEKFRTQYPQCQLTAAADTAGRALDSARNSETGMEMPVGMVDLFDLDPVNLRAGVGIIICDEADRRRGYASEALDLLARYASETLGLRRIYCSVEAGNLPSAELFRSRGFVEAGARREWLLRDGVWLDEMFFQKALPPSPDVR